MKILGRIVAVVVAALCSVVAIWRIVRRLYTDVGRKYIVIDQMEQREGA